MARFITPCCKEHEADEQTQERETGRILKGLGEMRRAIRSWLIVSKFTNVILIDPMLICGVASDAAAARSLMKDTVHMKKEGYAKVAAACREKITEWLRGKKRKASCTETSTGEAKRPRIEAMAGTGKKPSHQRGGRGGARRYY